MNLLDVVSGFFTPDVVSKMASGGALSDEAPANVRKAMGVAVPVLFAGLGQASASRIGADRIFGVLSNSGQAGLLERFGGMTDRQTSEVATEGQTLLARLLGDRAIPLTDLVARSSGVSPTSAASIMGAVTAISGGVLSREIATRDLDAGGVADLLDGEKKAIAGNPHTPAALASMVGAGTVGASASTVGASASEVGKDAVREGKDVVRDLREPKRDEPSRRPRWLPAAVLAALAVVAVWALAKSRRPDMAVVAPPAPPPAVTPEVVERLPTTSEDIKLPDGTVVHLNPTSGEADLARYLGSGAGDLPRRFILRDLQFDTDSTRLTPTAVGRVDSLAGILKAYPSARIRIEGFTDGTGNTTTNHALSVARADEMRRMLADRGVAPARIDVQGKGASEPIAPNDTPEGRAQNRRIEIVVLER